MRTKKEETHTEKVTAAIKNDIVVGKIAPGSKLIISNLKKEYNVSISVIREALTRLTELELVTFKPNIGFNVSTVSSEKLLELKEARIINEGAAIELAIKRGSLEWESELIAAHYRLEATPMFIGNSESEVLNPEWTDMHKNFHMTIVLGASNEILSKICFRLWNQSELYRSQAILHDKSRLIAKEHKMLLDAIVKRDLDAALKIHTAHVGSTVTEYLKIDSI